MLWSVIEALQRQRSPRSIKRVTRPRLRESRWRGLRHHRQVLARARAVTGMLRNRALRGSLPARMLLPASWLLLEPPIRSPGLLEACCSAHLNGTRCGAPPCTLALPACKAASRALPTATVRRTSVSTISHDTAKAVAIARAALGGPEFASVRATARKSRGTQCRVGPRASWNVCESRISVISGPNRLQAKRTCGIHCRARESSVGDGRSGHFLLTGHDPGSQYPMCTQ